VNPDTLQTFGVLAIGLGFVLIGLGGISTYHASQKMQHQAEMREVQQKGEMNQQIMNLLLRNQQLVEDQVKQKEEPAPPVAPAQQPQPQPNPPQTYYYRPPSPPPPNVYFSPTPAPVGERPPESTSSLYPGAEEQPASVEGDLPSNGPVGESMAPDTVGPPGHSDWEPPESLEPELPGRYLSIHQQHVIADTLRSHGRHVVLIESSYGDPVSREFAEELGHAFGEADWIVTGISEHRGLPLASGVTVSAASFPPAPETRAMYEALLSAGIAVSQQLDPKQQRGETMVLVGTPL
jgi:hypothetical protein